MINQLRSPNFKSEGKLFLVRCYQCDPVYGLENYGAAVASGQCAWCGWKEEPKIYDSTTKDTEPSIS